MKRIGWFSSGRDRQARNLLLGTKNYLADYDVEIAWVFCNEQHDEFAQLVYDLQIPLVYLDSARFIPECRKRDLIKWRTRYGKKIADVLNFGVVDVTVLAGYMLVLGEPELSASTFLNLHPALPDGPTGAWDDVIRQVVANNAGRHGCMVHEATAELDRGPVVVWEEFSIKGPEWDLLWHPNNHKALFWKIRREGERMETPLLQRAIMEYLRKE